MKDFVSGEDRAAPDGGMTPYAVPKPHVKKRCASCARREPGWLESDWDGIVSPSGVEHHPGDYGMTDCGVDATSDKWWWPL